MDWERAIRQERAALMRIAALLCALAGLAELAAGRSAAVRGFVIWLLRRAEPVAWDFVADDWDMPFASGPAVAADGSPAEAMRLAASFRQMAQDLEWQAAQLLVLVAPDGAWTMPLRSRPMAALRALAETLGKALTLSAAFGSGFSLPAPDTS